MNSQRSGEDETPTPPSAPFQPLQMQPPPAQVQAPRRPQQPTVVSNLAMGRVLDMWLGEAKDPFFVCEELGLQAKRALACTCSALRPVIFQLLRQPRLVVQEHDAIWDNARFVANVLMQSVPQQTLSVAGETCVPEMKLAHLRTLPRLKVGTMGPTAALFFGAAISDSDCVLRLSTGATKSIRVLRENDRINLQMPEIAQSSDRNAMLGALMLGAVRAASPVTHPSKRCKVTTVHAGTVSMAMHVSRISGISVCHEAFGSCLSLGRAGICDAGMMFLAPTLHRPHCMLSRIDLSVNSFGDKGLIALAPALRQLPALKSLNLGNNRFGDEGLAALVPPPALPVGALPPPSGVLPSGARPQSHPGLRRRLRHSGDCDRQRRTARRRAGSAARNFNFSRRHPRQHGGEGRRAGGSVLCLDHRVNGNRGRRLRQLPWPQDVTLNSSVRFDTLTISIAKLLSLPRHISTTVAH